MKDWLSMFSDDESQTILCMLSCIVDHPNEYQNEIHFMRGDGQVMFFIETPGASITHNPGEITGGSSLVTKMSHAGLIEMLAPPPMRIDRRGKVRGGEPNSFYFTEAAREHYQKRGEIDDRAVRRTIGVALYESYLSNPDEILELPVDQIAANLGVAPTRIRQQTRVLRDLQLLNDIAPVNSAIDVGPLELTKRGLYWALSGFPDNLSLEPSVQVSVHINIQNLVHEIQEMRIPEDERQEVSDLVKEIQREPTTEKVARLMGMAANIQQLAPSIIRFISQNGHALTQYLPG